MALFLNLSLPLIITNTDLSVYKFILIAFKMAHPNVCEKINGKFHIKNVDIRYSVMLIIHQLYYWVGRCR